MIEAHHYVVLASSPEVLSGWRWSQYIVSIIDGVVFLLLFFSFEETMFPRFLFSSANPEHIEAAVAMTSTLGEKVALEQSNVSDSPSANL